MHESGSLTWADKAKMVSYLIKAASRMFTITRWGDKTDYKQALLPRSSVSSLTPLGAPLMAGLARRPVWASRLTPSAVAANVWRARASDRFKQVSSSRGSWAGARARTFANDWEIDYSHFPSENRWQPDAIAKISMASEAAKRRQQELQQAASEQEKRRPCEGAPPSTTTTSSTSPSTTGRSRPRHEEATHGGTFAPPHRPANGGIQQDAPLPAMSRAYKKARLNEPASQEDRSSTSRKTLASSTPPHRAGPMQANSSEYPSSAWRHGGECLLVDERVYIHVLHGRLLERGDGMG